MGTALIEIKSSTRIEARHTSQLARFSDAFGEPLSLCISRDPARLSIDGVRCLHWRDALEVLGLV